MKNGINLDRLPKAKFTLKESFSGKKNENNFFKIENRRMKLEAGELKSELFELFEKNSKLTFDQINREVDQPRVLHLKITPKI